MKYKGQTFYGKPPLLYVRDIIKKQKLRIVPRDVYAYWQAKNWCVDSLENAVKIYYNEKHPKPPTKTTNKRKTIKNDLSYAEQLNDRRWFAFRERVFKERGRKCERCGSVEHLQIHHLEYKGAKLAWRYKISEVIVLCDTCHSRLHHKDNEAQQQERHLRTC